MSIRTRFTGRSFLPTIAVLALTLFTGGAAANDCAAPTLNLTTDLGKIVIAMHPDAAPRSVARLISGDRSPTITFSHTKPHVELRTSSVLTATAALPLEIDATALHLDQTGLDDIAMATNAVQERLIPTYRKSLRGVALTQSMQRWLEKWFATYDAAFLVGTRWQQLYEAQGVIYTPGLNSMPVTRGSVALVPSGMTAATSRLSFALTDAVHKNGLWPVVGQVTEGLDLLERIAKAPRQMRSSSQPSRYAPVEPIAITAIVTACASAQ